MLNYSHIVSVFFIISLIYLLAGCVIAAGRIDPKCKVILKLSLALVILGAGIQIILFGKGVLHPLWMACSIPVFIGVASWFILNRRIGKRYHVIDAGLR